MGTTSAQLLRPQHTAVAGTIAAMLLVVGVACSDSTRIDSAETGTEINGAATAVVPAVTEPPATVAPPPSTSSAPTTSAPTTTSAPLPKPTRIDVPGHDDRPTLLLRSASDTAPLLVVFHGSRGSIENVQQRSGLDTAAALAGVSVLWLSGKPLPERSWNTNNRCCEPASTKQINDLGYVDTAIETVRRLGLRPVRIVSTGVSNGAGMAVSTACKRPGVFAAAVSVAGWLPITCRDRSISLVAIAGTEDDVIGRRTAREMATTWRRTVVTCTNDVSTTRRGIATISTWSGCRDGTYVRLVLLDGIGHVWPRFADYDATEEIIAAATTGW